MPKRRNATTVRAEENESARHRRERDEALARETATSEVLRLISKSPGDLELVFRSILENATASARPSSEFCTFTKAAVSASERRTMHRPHLPRRWHSANQYFAQALSILSRALLPLSA
jgi:hypothetical protein